MSISVVITTYNRPDYLRQSLASVLVQTTHAEQILVVDDASDQKHRVAIEQVISDMIGQSDLNIEFHRLSEKKGANAARNKGVQLARGDIVAFLDDDDSWHSDFLTKHYDTYKNDSQVMGVLCGKQIMGTTNKYIHSDHIVTKASLRPGNEYCGMSGVSIKRSLLLTQPFDEKLTNGQDWDLFVRLCCANYKLVNIHEALYEYRKNTPNSISTVAKTLTIDKAEARLASSTKHRAFLGEHYYKIRVADQLLTFILDKPDKAQWLFKCIKIAGVKITLQTLWRKLVR